MKIIRGLIRIFFCVLGLLFIIGSMGFWNMNLPLALCCLIFGIAFIIRGFRKNNNVYNEEEWEGSHMETIIEEEVPEYDYARTKDGELVYVEKSLTNDNFYTTLDGKHTFIRYKNGILSEIN